ncbi:cell division protein FtsQ/DivIB [Nocardia sp. alder85J]|uniref:cell division protein FtsQ/DivIB n=1 Tax=Nocardia sp. alder85J TaxID=2862949 RepID=UPI001CD80FD7|nr:FtsQ-type POTRA domain-containing protein [Nocardia sp. alder85J]MCX4095234.1 FtsQ-type POTRA domain-containing protein [Nocardia sp. alder85J]
MTPRSAPESATRGARGADPDADETVEFARPGSGSRRGLADSMGGLADSPAGRLAMRVLPVLGVLLLLAGIAWFTPALSVRTLKVEGLSAVSEQQIRAALAVPSGRSMLRIDTEAMAARVAALPRVRSVRVQRVFPSTVRVTVVERTPALYFDGPDGSHLIDSDSVEFAVEQAPPTLPKLTTDHPGGSDPVTKAAVDVLDATPQELRDQVGEVVARSVSDVALNLRDGRIVLWGGPDDSTRKAAVVLPILSRPGTLFDVSSPDLVTVR